MAVINSYMNDLQLSLMPLGIHSLPRTAADALELSPWMWPALSLPMKIGSGC
jgi:hypothetical protein